MTKFLLLISLLACWACPVQAQKQLPSAARAWGQAAAEYSASRQAAKQAFGNLPVRPARALPPARQVLTPQAARQLERTALQAHAAKQSAAAEFAPGRYPFARKQSLLSFFVQRQKELEPNSLPPDPSFNHTLEQIDRLKTQYPRFNRDDIFEWRFNPLQKYSSFAAENNRIVLKALQNYIQKMQWVQSYPDQARKRLAKETGWDAVYRLAQRLSKERLVMLGEEHYVPEFQRVVAHLVSVVKAQNPSRRVVLFTEFLDLIPAKHTTGKTLETYYRRMTADSLRPVTDNELLGAYAAGVFLRFLKEGVEVYPLEDGVQMNLMGKQDEDFSSSLLGCALRNKTWARVIEAKMAEIRQTDPDALFIVYAGQGHTSWLVPYALPKFFAKENPAVVELSLSSGLSKSSAANIWDFPNDFLTSPPLLKNTFFYWKGKDAKELAKHTGFDYLLAVPEYSEIPLKEELASLREGNLPFSR